MERKCDDWLTRYIQYTRHTEPPVLYHLWCGIMAISSCLQRKTYLHWGYNNIYPNIFTVLVGPPGGRKGTAMKMAKGMLQELKIPLASDCVTAQQLYREVAETEANYRTGDGTILLHKSLSIWSEEFAVFIGHQNIDMITALTDLFDCPDTWDYSTKNKGQDDLSNTYLALIGAITPKVLQNKLTQEAVGGGLISRIIFVVGYGREKLIALPFPSKEDYDLYEDLLIDLEQIKNLSGPFQFSEKGIEVYAAWYENPANSDAINMDHFEGYNARRALHLRKLAMIISASESNNMIIREHHFNTALNILHRTEKEMPNAFFGLGRGDHAQALTDILVSLQREGSLSWTEIVDGNKLDHSVEELSKIMQLLEATGRVTRDISMGGKVKYLTTDKEDVAESKPDELKNSVLKYHTEDKI